MTHAVNFSPFPVRGNLKVQVADMEMEREDLLSKMDTFSVPVLCHIELSSFIDANPNPKISLYLPAGIFMLQVKFLPLVESPAPDCVTCNVSTL